jgi:hypothetical protein
MDYPMSATQTKRNKLINILTTSFPFENKKSLFKDSRSGLKTNTHVKQESKKFNYDLT